MAGGIDWFRWHHGSVNDPKFRLVAKKAGARTSEVLAVWGCLLENASSSVDRGNVGDLDFEAIDLALDMDDGTAERIYARMCDRGLIDGETKRVTAWERRQPKRERDDDNSTERVRAFREKKRREEAGNANDSHETQVKRQETPRREERREEEKKTSAPKGEPSGFDAFWAAWPTSTRKGGKSPCAKFWADRRLEADGAAIVAHVKAMARTEEWSKESGRYVPAPVVYLRAAKWDGAVLDALTRSEPQGRSLLHAEEQFR